MTHFKRTSVYSMILHHRREAFSGFSHLFGALLSLLAIPYMLYQLPTELFATYLASYLVFGLAMFLMFSASAVYHLAQVSEESIRKLKRLDHMAIFIMIAGSYTPFCLIALEPPLSWWMFAVVWGIALSGILIKVFWLHAPRMLSTALYLAMGWVAIIVYEPLAKGLSGAAINWLVAGGLAYSVGAVIYACKWPNLHRKFAFHELWHLFVLAGATCHFISIALYL